jgi:NADPH2 dehydrogenase
VDSLLATPLEIGNVKLKNRLVMAPVATAKAGFDGNVSQELVQHYDEKTRGGFLSLVIVEHSYVSARGKANTNQLSAASDEVLTGFKYLTQAVHANGSKIVLELNHAGSGTSREIIGSDPVAPSAIRNPSKANSELPLELTEDEIQDITNDFVKAAVRAKNAGFDGIDIHSCHGYLLNQFLSPLTNKRTDSYGGDIYSRIRIHLDIVKAIRHAVGNDYLILLRLGVTDHSEDGLTIEDGIAAAQALERSGIDILDISGGMCRYAIPGVDIKEYFSQLSKTIKSALSIPVIVTGGITKAPEAEELLRDDRADLIGVGRAILRDSNWARDAMEDLV